MDSSNHQTPKNKFLKDFGFCLKQIRKNRENRATIAQRKKAFSWLPVRPCSEQNGGLELKIFSQPT
jgi:hypothetical protein